MPGEVTLTHQLGKEYFPVTGGSQVVYILLEAKPTALMVQVHNVALTLRLPAGVSLHKAGKVLPMIEDMTPSALPDRQVSVVLGDLEKETAAQSVLIELMIDPRPTGLCCICQAELTHDVPLVGLTREHIRDDIEVTFTTDTNLTSQANAFVMNCVERTNAQRLVTQMLDEYKRRGHRP